MSITQYNEDAPRAADGRGGRTTTGEDPMPFDGVFWLLVAQWLLFWLFWYEDGYVAGA